MNVPVCKSGSPRDRLSLQICRIVYIMQALYRSKEASADEIHSIVNRALPKPVCRRTIRRDLQALIEVGFVETRRTTPTEFSKHGSVFYSVTSPNLINGRIDNFWRQRQEGTD